MSRGPRAGAGRRASLRAVLLTGLAVSALLAGVVSAWASANPDGLEYVAGRLGFLDTATDHASASSPLADYAVRGLDGPVSGGLAGLLGLVVVAVLAFGLMWLLRGRTRSTR